MYERGAYVKTRKGIDGNKTHYYYIYRETKRASSRHDRTETTNFIEKNSVEICLWIY